MKNVMSLAEAFLKTYAIAEDMLDIDPEGPVPSAEECFDMAGCHSDWKIPVCSMIRDVSKIEVEWARSLVARGA